MDSDILEQAKRYCDDALELCFEEIKALRARVERLESANPEGQERT